MKYGFLTTLIPKHLEDEVRRCSKYNMQDAANALQWHIYDGLSANTDDEIRIFNVLCIGSYPQYYTKSFIKKSQFDDVKNKGHVNIGFCNIKLLRKFHQPKKIFSELNKWYAEDSEPKTLFVYTISAQFVTAVSRLKNKYPELKVCAIIADLPDMSSLTSKKSLAQRLLEKRLSSNSYSNIGCVDSFVLLTKQMADYMNINQPFMVMEGISTNSKPIEAKESDSIKRILYTGTLHKKFGIMNLIEAFKTIDSPDYRLVICGIGDSEDEIKKAADLDSRIDFKGQLKREDVLSLQKEATVLVNPRPNNEEFTKYSFPSKNLEYLSSGIPLVAYKLDGIPDEYDEYINYVPDDSPESLAKVIQGICDLPVDERKEMGIRARNFVLEEKNNVKQTKRILDFIKDGI